MSTPNLEKFTNLEKLMIVLFTELRLVVDENPKCFYFWDKEIMETIMRTLKKVEREMAFCDKCEQVSHACQCRPMKEEPKKMEKEWCKDIFWDGEWYTHKILGTTCDAPRDWKVCPWCMTPKPTPKPLVEQLADKLYEAYPAKHAHYDVFKHLARTTIDFLKEEK